MREDWPDLPAQFDQLQKDLAAAHARIAELESQLGRGATPSQPDYRNIVEHQMDLICRYTPDFVLTYVNTAYAECLGKRPADLIGANLLNHIAEIDRERAIHHVQSLTLEHPVAISEHRTLMPDRTTHWVEWIDRALFDETGTPREYLGVGRDTTERLSSEQHLQFMVNFLHATNNAPDVKSALETSLRFICNQNHWEYGEIWMSGENDRITLRKDIYFIQDAAREQVTPFRTATEDYTLSPGYGLPGKTWLTQSTNWVPDVQALQTTEFYRRDLARAAGLHGAVAVPLVDNGETLAVLLFLALETIDLDEKLLRVLSVALNHLAPVLRRKQAGEALAASEERFRRLVESSDAVIALFDASGKTLYLNEVAARSLGLTPDTMIGKTMHDLFPPPIVALQLPGIQEVIDTGEGVVNESISVVAGENRWYRTSIQPVRNTEGVVTAALVNSVDITHVKETEAALRQNERRFELFMSNFPGVVFIFDHDNTLVYCNDRYATSVKHTVDDIIGKKADEFLGPALSEVVLAENTLVLEQNQVVKISYTSPPEFGFKHWLLIKFPIPRDNLPPLIGAISLDVTKQKHAEEALSIREEMYRTLVDNVDGVITINDTDGRYLFANDQAWRPFNLPPEERAGKTPFDLFPHETAELFVKRVREVIATAKSRTDVEGVPTGPDFRWFQSTIAPLRNPDGTITSAMTLSTDVTSIKQAEEALRASEELYRSLSESSDALIMLFDWEVKCLYLNERTANMWRKPLDALIGKHVHEIFPVAYANQMIADIQKVISEAHGLIQEPVEMSVRGERHWFRVSIQPVRDATGQPHAALVYATDITAQTHSELALERAVHRLNALHTIDQSILRADTVEAVAEAALDNIFTSVPCHRASLITIDVEECTGYIVATRFEGQRTTVPARHTYELDPAIVKTLIEQRYLFVNDLADRPVEVIQSLYNEGVRTILNIGLKQQGQLVGSLNLHGTTDTTFTPEIIEMALEIADQLAISIHTSQLNEQIRQYTLELEQRVAQRTEELERSKTRVEAILNSSSDGILLISVEHGIQQANPAFHTLFGCMDSACLGKSLETLILSDDRERVTNTANAVIAQGTIQRLEVRAQRLDGSIFDVSLGLAPVKGFNGDGRNLVCTIRDISELKLAERTLRQSEQMLTSVIENIPVRVCWKDRDSVLQGCNTLHARTVGLASREQIVGMTDFDFNPATASKWRNRDRHVMETEQPELNLEEELPQADGSSRWLRYNRVPLRDAEGAIIGVLVMIEDITEHKQAQLAIAEERNLLRTLIDAMPEYIYVKDREHRFLLSNVSHAQARGCATIDEIIGKTDADFFTAELAAQFHAEEAIIFQTGQPLIDYEQPSMSKYGGFPWASSTKVPLHNVDGDLIGLVGITRDITERREAEHALRQYAEEVHDLYNNAPCGYHSLDANGLIIQINDTELQWLGYSREEVIGKLRITDIMTTESLVTFRKTFPAFKERGWVSDLEFEFLRKDGTGFNVILNGTAINDEQGNYLNSRSTMFDITELKLAQTALRESEERYRTVINTMSEGAILQSADGIIQTTNAAAERILGLTQDQIMGRTSMDPRWSAVHEDGSPFPGETHPVMVTLRTGQPQSNVVMGVYRPEAGLAWILINASPVIYEGDDHPRAAVSTFTDISDRKQYEETLVQALNKEKELNELKSRFVSVASHEFRTPLAAILATAETLVYYRQRMDEGQINARLDKIRQQVHHMKSIMEEVLQLARIQAGHIDFNPVSGDLNALCEEIIEEFRSQLDYRERIIYNGTETPVIAEIDLRLMRQVISNLISNALKYSPPDKSIRFTLSREASSITCQVSDEGIGIPPEDRVHLFEPFHRSRNVGVISGTGLGLSITKEAVEAHGGTITVESEVDSGTTFTVIIPVAH